MKKRFVILDVIYCISFVLVCLIVLLLIRKFNVEKQEMDIDFSKNVLLKQQDNCLLFKYDDKTSTDDSKKEEDNDIINGYDQEEDGWIKLYDLSELHNEVVNNLDNTFNENEFDFRVYENMIQWSFLGSDEWHDLISIFDIIPINNESNDDDNETIEEPSNNKYKDDIVIAVNNNVNDLGCYSNGNVCEKGTLITLKVNKDTVYNFYVIEDDGDKITLIKDSNIGDDDIKTLSWTDEQYNMPVYSLTLLNYLTRNWDYIDYIDEYSFMDSDENNVINIENGIGKYIDEFNEEHLIDGVFRARFLSLEEAYFLGCRDLDYISRCEETKCIHDYDCPYWIYKNLGGKTNSLYPFGYWLFGTDVRNNELGAYAMLNNGGYILSSIYDMSRFGIRPVISIKRIHDDQE